jgi:hypothetical protein
MAPAEMVVLQFLQSTDGPVAGRIELNACSDRRWVIEFAKSLGVCKTLANSRLSIPDS